MTALYTLLVVSFIIVLAFTIKATILRAIACPLCLVYGLTIATDATIETPLWIAGIGFAILGLYFLYDIALEVVKKVKQ